jgi:hypothetical protein
LLPPFVSIVSRSLIVGYSTCLPERAAAHHQNRGNDGPSDQGVYHWAIEDPAHRWAGRKWSPNNGKQGLLGQLIAIWTSDPLVQAASKAIDVSRDPVDIVRQVASGSRQLRERFADVMRVVLTTAPHDPGVAEQLRQATKVRRTALVPIARRLAKLGALRAGLEIADAVDALWFYFGYSSFLILLDDNGWSYERAERWLGDQACRELLGEPGDRRRAARRT